jgi:hypothetical protein
VTRHTEVETKTKDSTRFMVLCSRLQILSSRF